MTAREDAAADTTMMRIVHDALRRDLARATAALGRGGTDASQRRAIGAHLVWMVEFLDAHHHSEDLGLYPLVRERVNGEPASVEVLDRMTSQHQAVAPAAEALASAASRLAKDGAEDSAREVSAALDALSVVLLPHLEQEESEAMPVTARLITAAEWRAIEQEHNLDPRSMSELGFEGHWLIDGATDGDRALVVGLVPRVPRFLLLHGFGRRYRRHAEACWRDGAKPARGVQLENRVEVTVDASVSAVWEVVRDVTRVGEWSHECVSADWLGEPAAPVPGARFRGRNRAGIFRWGRVCEVVAAEPYQLVWRTVPTGLYPDSSEWRIALEETDGVTRIEQSFRVLRAPRVLSVVYATVIPAHRDRTAALIGDLQRLGAVARAPRPRIAAKAPTP